MQVSVSDKGTIICEGLTKQRGSCFGSQTNEEVTMFVYTAVLALNSLTLLIKMLSVLLVQGRYFHMGGLFPTIRENKRCKRGVSFFNIICFPPAISQVTLVQNNQ